MSETLVEKVSLWKGWVTRKKLIGEVFAEVAKRHGLTVADLVGPSRLRQFAWPRQEAFYLAKMQTGASFPEIGRFARRDHTTVIHGVKAHAARIGDGT